MKDALKVISEIISKKMELPLADIKATSNLIIDLGVGSLDEVLIYSQLEYDHGIDISRDVFEEFKSVQDIVDCIAKLLK